MSEGFQKQNKKETVQELPEKELELRAHIRDLEQMADSIQLKTMTRGVNDVDYEEKIEQAEEKLRNLEKERRMKDVVGNFTNKAFGSFTENISKTMSVKDADQKEQKENPTEKVVPQNEPQKEQEQEQEKPQNEPQVEDTAQRFAEKVSIGKIRMKMLTAESEYLSALRKQYKNKKALSGVLGKSRAEKIQMEETKKLQETYDTARSEFASAVSASFETRYGKKKDKYEKTKKTSPYVDKEKLLSRYNRMVVSSDVIRRAMREKVRAKQEALSEKEKNSFKKAFDWYIKGNQALEKKVGKVGAKGIRILALATIGGAAGGFLAVGHRILRSGIGAVFGTGASLAAGKIYEVTGGLKSKEMYKNTSQKTILSVDDIKKQEKAYEKGSDESVARKRRIVEALTAVIVGAGASVETAHIIASSNAVNIAVEKVPIPVQTHTETVASVVHTDVTKDIPNNTSGNILDSMKNAPNTAYDTLSHLGSNNNVVSNVGHVVSEHAETVTPVISNDSVPNIPNNTSENIEYSTTPIQNVGEPIKLSGLESAASSQIQDIISVSEGKGDGADALFGHLKESLRSAYPDINTAPPEVRHILATRLHALSTEYGFAKPDESALMHTNDTLSYDPNKGELIFTNSNGTHVLEKTTDGNTSYGQTFDKFDGQYVKDQNNINTYVGDVNESDIKNVNPSYPHEMPNVADGNVSDKMPTPLTPNVSETIPTVTGPVTLHGEVTELLSPEVLGRHANASFYEVFYQSPGIPSQLHERLMDVVERSGVGPTENETLEHFLNRADSVGASEPMEYVPGIGNLSVPINETHLYTNVNGDIVVYGGDQPARHLVAYQYLTKHSGAKVLFERGGNGPASGVNSLTINESPVYPADKELLQSFSLVKDASGAVVKHIDPNTLKSVVH